MSEVLVDDALAQDHQLSDKIVQDDVVQVCTPEHCFIAFDTLYCSLTGAHPLTPQYPDEKYPLFVTWNIKRSDSLRLRGCIGNFEPMPLHEAVPEYALISAFKDTRFRKIEERELERLECSVSLLTNFEDASTYLDWTIGVHGIYISFPHPSTIPTLTSSGSSTPSPLSSSASLPSTRFNFRKRNLTATYLPDVIPEQGWTKVEAVDSAIRKAGWDGRITEDLRRNVKLRRYQSQLCNVTWDEFVQWREQRAPGST
ncbi:hypothetical protein SISNIDRAFT_405874 [Sistotremastrum niveocremeum HHB9708]|uniref:AMMECR1 domain-containing protein n=1 Tax=Sistotremastrum niveocremeum HHB9708 TaxID=1314777 RepID=A0A164Z5L3_9AGAM|nr:hypothetical protein SISNIDRAFT_405874 [Sistotremastrum niveocremeum HHB9708]